MNPLANKFQPKTLQATTVPYRNHMNISPRDDVDALADVFNEKLRKSPVERKEISKCCTFGPRKPSWKSNITRAASARRNAITPPSKESGGIPEPTPEYLAASLLPLENLTEAQHLLVVIDLNGTLLFRPNKRNPSSLIARPNTARFLKYCLDTFSVVIWSSARPANVDLMCNQILNADTKNQVVDIWARDKFDLTQEDYNLRTMCYKRLTRHFNSLNASWYHFMRFELPDILQQRRKIRANFVQVWNDPKIAASHPGFQRGERWNHTNTVLVDDSPEKGRSEPYNLITIPQFSGDAYEQGQILPQVHDYLNSLSLHSNVAAYLRACPFQAVMPEHPSPVHLQGPRQVHSSLDPAEAASHSASKVGGLRSD
ncbi:phosphoprotein phosphatase [Diplocarpon rosae]|nr:phosphoprotein phosphatase [Diplocarpon rosae]